jgi:hypothetical protein
MSPQHPRSQISHPKTFDLRILRNREISVVSRRGPAAFGLVPSARSLPMLDATRASAASGPKATYRDHSRRARKVQPPERSQSLRSNPEPQPPRRASKPWSLDSVDLSPEGYRSTESSKDPCETKSCKEQKELLPSPAPHRPEGGEELRGQPSGLPSNHAANRAVLGEPSSRPNRTSTRAPRRPDHSSEELLPDRRAV